tara:strand:- start:341 stop:823 length:483 start_codon:yes stop_codon:yes gene_type:complete
VGLIKQAGHEFSFVPGFGDDVRNACDHGFPQEVQDAIQSKYPHVVVVYYLVTKKFLAFAKGGNGKLYRIRELEDGETWSVVDRLDEANWAARNRGVKEAKRMLDDEVAKKEAIADKEYEDAALAACDPEFTEFLVRRYRDRVLNVSDPFVSVSVPASAPV